MDYFSVFAGKIPSHTSLCTFAIRASTAAKEVKVKVKVKALVAVFFAIVFCFQPGAQRTGCAQVFFALFRDTMIRTQFLRNTKKCTGTDPIQTQPNPTQNPTQFKTKPNSNQPNPTQTNPTQPNLTQFKPNPTQLKPNPTQTQTQHNTTLSTKGGALSTLKSVKKCSNWAS